MEGDSSVTAYSEVKEIVVLRGVGSSTYQGGVVYIQGSDLFYEADCVGGCLCCTCRRKHFTLSKIHRVELIEDEVVKYKPKPNQKIELSPGIRISVHKDTTVLVSLATDANEFSRHLKTASNLVN